MFQNKDVFFYLEKLHMTYIFESFTVPWMLGVALIWKSLHFSKALISCRVKKKAFMGTKFSLSSIHAWVPTLEVLGFSQSCLCVDILYTYVKCGNTISDNAAVGFVYATFSKYKKHLEIQILEIYLSNLVSSSEVSLFSNTLSRFVRY